MQMVMLAFGKDKETYDQELALFVLPSTYQ